MPIRTDIPEISVLKSKVEEQFGHRIESRSDFSLLAFDIEKTTRDHIGENTLRRIWGAMKGYNTAFSSTLDVLCRYIGYSCWHTFQKSLNGDSKSGTPVPLAPVGAVTVSVDSLAPGDRLKMAWLPDRSCIVEFLGGKVFRTLEAHNSSLQEGDTFECTEFVKGCPLVVDNVVHGGEISLRCAMGLDKGLTVLEKL